MPALKFGAKITPSDIAGMIGLPYVGEIYYIDPTNGNDTSHSGKEQNKAYKTLTQAESQMVAYSHDIAVVVSGGTDATAETANVTWDKDYTHIIGNCAPTHISQRARIKTTTDSVDPCFTLSANGCIWSNIQIGSEMDSNDVTISMTGDRNYFSNVHFIGMASTTAGDDATGRIISFSGASENLFDNCVIGVDTIPRSEANASMEFASSCCRNKFVDCLIPLWADSATALFVKAGTTSIDRYLWFKDCLFHNAVYSASTTLTVAMDLTADMGGNILLDGCSVQGVTDWADDYTLLYGMNMPDITAANAGFLEKIAT